MAIAEYSINFWKLFTFLNKKQPVRNMWWKGGFYLQQQNNKNMKYLDINLTRNVWDLFRTFKKTATNSHKQR